MKFSAALSDDATLRELGERLSRYRLNRNQAQAALADEAGVSLSTVIRLEQGESVQLTSLLRVLRALGLLDSLDALVPAPALSPIQQLKRQGKVRRRASGSGDAIAETPAEPWSWNDEEEEGGEEREKGEGA